MLKGEMQKQVIMAASFAGPADSYKSLVPAQGAKLIALAQCVFHCQDLQKISLLPLARKGYNEALRDI